jgi:hypothetical protein
MDVTDILTICFGLFLLAGAFGAIAGLAALLVDRT